MRYIPEQGGVGARETKRAVVAGVREILAVLNADRPQTEVLDYIAERGGALVEADAAAVYRLQEDGRYLFIKAARGLPAGFGASQAIPVGREPLGQAVLSGRPVYVPDMAATLREIRLTLPPKAHAHLARVRDHYRTVLAVPLVARGRLYGALVLYFRAARLVAPDEIELMTAFGEQAGLAIAHGQTRWGAEQIAAQGERNRLARDLHDTVKPALFSANIIAEVLPDLWDVDPAEGRRRLDELRELTRTALAEVRTLLTVWRPDGLDEAGLGNLLGKLAVVVSNRTQIPISVSAEEGRPLLPDVQLAFYRIAQEALNNIAHHSQATRAWVTLRWQGRQVRLSITDNGRGFDPGAVGPGHLGLGIMRERAESAGAGFQVVSRPGSGTAVTVMWSETEGVEAQ